MRTKLTALVAGLVMLGTIPTASASGNGAGADGHGFERQLAQLREATAHYQQVSNALADGYGAFTIGRTPDSTPTTGLGLPGDPSCFVNGSGGMGVHYVKGIDGTIDMLHPEALVYSVDDHARLRLVAVEYIIPDSVDPAQLPVLFGQSFHHHDYLPVYVLHVWVWKDNPSGMFADWNPRVGACPSPAG